MRLEDIGFYTLSDERARNISATSPLWRCELLLTDQCNFKCPYCRGMRPDLYGTLSLEQAKNIVNLWSQNGLKNIRFSGGEPTLYPRLVTLIDYTKSMGVQKIALSTNGSAGLSQYLELLDAGINDFSISLDACCAAFGYKMNGKVPYAWEKTVHNIEALSKKTYVTVGCVFDENNADMAREVVKFADQLGVADIRIISSAQYNKALRGLYGLDGDILNRHPILAYRIKNYVKGINVRGLGSTDSSRCYLVMDDMAIAKNYHFPCIIYLREDGKAIGGVGPKMRKERISWSIKHNVFDDPICRKNCLDVCRDFNNRVRIYDQA